MSDKYFKITLLVLLFLIVCGLFNISAKIQNLDTTIKRTRFYEDGQARYIQNNDRALKVRLVQ